MSAGRGPSPYKFLDSYGLEDGERFFGRDLETDLLLADVVVSRLVVLFAKTGTGKTSLINAGVRPRLHRRGYTTYVVRVREDPFASTRAVLREQAPKAFPRTGRLGEQLRALAARLGRPVVLFFDQFEEFFLYFVTRDNLDRVQDFVATVGDLYDDPDSGIHVVFSMREEWFVDMGLFRDRIPAIFHNESNLRLSWFDRSQARDAIVKPPGEEAYEPALVGVLLDELTESSRAVAPTPSPGEIEPAQLQIVCDTLWRSAANGRLTLAAYRELGEAGRSDSVARQILDRRLVQQFENLDRPQLGLLDLLLPELRTGAGTKRVREYEDLVGALLASSASTADRGAIVELLERLERDGLLDILPRESGRIVELTHDYLVVRLEELRAPIALIWPRRVLAEGVEAFRRDGRLLHSTVFRDVLAVAGALELGPTEGELVLRSALGHLADASPAMPALVRSGAAVWEIFRERIADGEDAERARAVETLVSLASTEATEVLREALADPRAAPQVLRLLERAQTEAAVGLLAEALRSPELASKAEAALAELASGPAGTPVADAAREQLHAILSFDDPTVVDRIVRLDAPVAVDMLEAAPARPDLDEVVRGGLLTLAGSTDHTVSARAGQALLTRVDAALVEPVPEPWCVEVLERIDEPAAVERLGLLLDRPPVADRARDALRTLTQSQRTDVASAAAKQLGRGVQPPPAPPRPPERVAATDRRGSAGAAHFDAVVRLLANGRLVPFLGDGANLVGRPPGTRWEPGTFLPTRPELAEHLALAFQYPAGDDRERPDLLTVAQYVEVEHGRGPLYMELRDVFLSDARPTPLHRLVAGLPGRFPGRTGSTQLVITTAFDVLLERAFAEHAEPVDVVAYVADGRDRGKFMHRAPDGATVIDRPADYSRLRPGERTVALRLFGGFDPDDRDLDSFVVSEDDYVDYATRVGDLPRFLPVTLFASLDDASFLFLGQSLSDWNVLILLQRLAGRTSSRGWAVWPGAGRVAVDVWRRRNVEIVDAPLDEYVAALDERLADFDLAAVPA